jgi:hypothetical protein
MSTQQNPAPKYPKRTPELKFVYTLTQQTGPALVETQKGLAAVVEDLTQTISCLCDKRRPRQDGSLPHVLWSSREYWIGVYSIDLRFAKRDLSLVTLELRRRARVA